MKAAAVVVLAVFGSAPFLAPTGMDWLTDNDIKRAIAEGDVSGLAGEIAEREFSTDVTLEVVEATRPRTILGEFGEKIRPDAGKEFRVLDVVVTNHGRLDVAAYSHHFSAVDARGKSYPAMLGIAEKFHAMRISTGQEEWGFLTFHVPTHVEIVAIKWQADFASAEFALDPAR